MRPRLVRSSGSAQTEIPLDAAGVTFGRDPANSIRLEDPVVSSRHCRIERENDRFVLIDNDSTNGTFVNGKAATKTHLEPGDEIRIGHTCFYFVVDEEDDSSGAASRIRIEDFRDNTLLSSETIQLNPSDSAYLKSGTTHGPQALQRMARDMGVLLRLSKHINEVDDSSQLQKDLLERIFQIIPAESGVILLGSDLKTLLQGPFVSLHRSSAERQIRVSRTIVQQVFASGESVLRNDLVSDVSSESIVASRVHSVLCVPLVVMNTRIGALYLATTNTGTSFDQQHLELVTAIAGIAAVALEHVRYVEWLEIQNRQLTDKVDLSHNMVGESAKMKNIYESISLVAPTESPVLILGESGTGKELAARAIHNNSSRRNGPFVAVNCGAIAEALFASELFGHVKGAFTGADRDKKGFMEEADGGTLFLDELGELPLHCQAALLRVLEEKQILRVGSTRPIRIDIRLISATNRSLAEEIRAGGFRADLYYRMGLPLELPPLRDRLDDIPLLVKFFIQKHKGDTQREIGHTPPETIRVLQQYHWPGNVRELGRAIQWAVVFGKSDRVRPEDLPAEIMRKEPASPGIQRLDQAMESFERQFILRALEETRGNVVEAAELLARAPNYLQRRISQFQLRDELDRIRNQR
jgi:transcriptional regulator with GAF, ATPase, and Fis domain